MTAGRFVVEDLWSPEPGGSLPAGPVLQAIAERCGAAWEQPDLGRRAKIGYSPRLRTSLGRAILNDNRVELNPRLLLDHPDELIPTLVHELAHLVVHWRYGRAAPHGAEFRTLMHAVGLPAGATHNLPVAHVKRPRRRYLYLHQCPACGNRFIARRVYRNYGCAVCGDESGFEIFRAPNSPAGRKLLQEAAADQP